ncbi:DoxX family protein [Paenibacillus ferrarius]|uniref:DoxX family protein n=1 Tax=Paenibacillus ferrarius TaxID=1469647 RepID=UPI003D2B39AD
MFINWVRTNKYAGIALLIIRLYLGFQWFIHGWDKLRDGFDAKGFLTNAVTKPVLDKATNELVYPTFTKFVEHFAVPNVKLINLMIPLGEFLVGLGLILGALTTAAAFFGLLMNFMFMFAGTVSTNPWFILVGFVLFIGGANTGRFGADYYLLPLIRNWVFRKKDPAAPKTGPGAGAAHLH